MWIPVHISQTDHLSLTFAHGLKTFLAVSLLKIANDDLPVRQISDDVVNFH
jgi:hypothetical protein